MVSRKTNQTESVKLEGDGEMEGDSAPEPIAPPDPPEDKHSDSPPDRG